ncbi:MAG: ATP-binding protein [Pseudomonadota bacterium]
MAIEDIVSSMQEEYLRHNLFTKGIHAFEEHDPHLEILKDLKFVSPLNWWADLDWTKPGIYILTGGRQIGKSTSTKLLIREVLKQKTFSAQQVFYLPCDRVDDYHHLARVISAFVEDIPKGEEGRFLIIIDEATFVPDWDRAIKALTDDGTLKRGFCIITGSDSVILKDAASRFPGRRGEADIQDFHLHPLNFHEYIKLVNPEFLKEPENHIEKILASFKTFLKCGGYLRAINDIHSAGEIRKATHLTFEQWIRGDFERRGKNAQTLLHLLATVFESAGTQVTYSSLTNKMGRVAKETFIDYVNLLERMDVLFALQAFDQNTRMGFPRKARKLHFWDPFIMDTVDRWLVAERCMKPRDTDPLKAESIAAANYRRCLPTYYLKADGEVDIVIADEKRFVPMEVKWTNQLRPNDLKQLVKYKEAVILTKTTSRCTIEGIQAVPLPLFLLLFPDGMPHIDG